MTIKKTPNPKYRSASSSLLPVIILLKLSILNVSSACPLRKAHVQLSPLKIIVFINLATDVRNRHNTPHLFARLGISWGKEEQT